MKTACGGVASPRTSGFSLIELVVLLAIVGLLAYFGIPAFIKFGLQGRLDLAEKALRQIAHQEAEWFGAHKSYANLQQLGYPAGSGFSAVYLNKDGSISENASGSSVYRIVINMNSTPGGDTPGGGAGSSPYYLLTAEPINDQAGDRRCGTLSLASTGQVGVSGSEGEGACWR